MMDKILFRKDGHVGTITFNNPERHNSVSLEMWEKTFELLKTSAADPDIRVLVVTGAGKKAFVSGADISKFGNERSTRDDVLTYDAATARVFTALHDFPRPTIAMIRGYCIGGGLALASACDIRIATAGSRFGIPAAKLGLGYDPHGVKRLVDIVGLSFAKEIFFTARQFDSEEARQMGLVNRVVADDELEAYVKTYTDTICGNAPLTIAAAKFAAGEAVKDAAARDHTRAVEMVHRCFDSRDYTEGCVAFMEKRKPAFTGA